MENAVTKPLNVSSLDDRITDDQQTLLARALEQIGQGVLVATNEGTIRYVNPKFCELTGYSAEELLGNNPRMLQSGSTSRETYLCMWNAISSGKTWQGELQNQRKNGEFYWERIAISPVLGGRGEITHYIAIVEDISQQKYQEEEIKHLQNQLQQLQKRQSLEKLSREIVGDFNNVLASVLGNAQLALHMSATQEEIRERLERILQSGRRAGEMISSLLTFSGGGLTTREKVNLPELVERHMQDLEQSAGGLEIEFNADASSSCNIKGDEEQLVGALIELVENSLTATEETDNRIIVTTGVDEVLNDVSTSMFVDFGVGSGRVAFLEVTDMGSGMHEEVLAQAFDPYFTTQPSAKGLGLARVLGVVHGHGGAVSVHTAPKEGTRIRMQFPMATDEDEAIEES